MMAWPPNELQPTVSYSSLRHYTACQRQWLYTYLPGLVPEPQRFEVVREKELITKEMLIGAVVDRAITQALRQYRDTQQWPADLYEDIGKSLLSGYGRFTSNWVSAAQDGRTLPKSPRGYKPIDCYYWGDGLSTEDRGQVKGAIRDACNAFMGPLVQGRVWSTSPETWQLPGGAVPWFAVGAIAVWANYDFITVTDDEVVIYDWKTGSKQHGETAALEQLRTYAAYAVHQWGVTPDQVRLVAVWLSECGRDRFTEDDVTADQLAEMRSAWVQWYRAAKAQRQEAKACPTKAMELYPMTDDAWQCRRCQFRSCEGWARGRGM